MFLKYPIPRIFNKNTDSHIFLWKENESFYMPQQRDNNQQKSSRSSVSDS